MMDPMLQRFPMDADDLDVIAGYFRQRAVQGLVEGWTWSGVVEPLVEAGAAWGARTRCQRADGVVFQSAYVRASARGRGQLSRYVSNTDLPFVTAPDCDLERFFQKRAVPYVLARGFTDRGEYRAIEGAFGDRRAARSGVFYMNHVDEGLAVLAGEGASESAMRAFALHPLFQLDDHLPRSIERLGELTDDPRVLVLAMEYRNVANAYLSERLVGSAAEVALGPLPEVAAMLRADKVQNYKDFLLYHRETHPRRAALDRYFRTWLERLEVPLPRFADWFDRLQVGADKVPPPTFPLGARVGGV